MIFDLRIYTLHNNKFAAWLKLYEEHGHATQVKHCGEPVFYATSEVGELNQVVHVWKYASQADREKRHPRSDQNDQAGLQHCPRPQESGLKDTQAGLTPD